MALLSPNMKPHFQTRHTLGSPTSTPPIPGGALRSSPPHQRHSLGNPPPRGGKVSLSPAPHQMRPAGSHTPRHPGMLPGHCVTVTSSPTDSPRHTAFSTPFTSVTATPRPSIRCPSASHSPSPKVSTPHNMVDTVSAPPPRIANHWRQADIDTSIKRGHGLCHPNHGWEAPIERPSRRKESSSPSKSRSPSRSTSLEHPTSLFHHRRVDSAPRQGPKLTIRSESEFTYDKVTASLACDLYNCTAGEARPSSRKKPGAFSPGRGGAFSPGRGGALSPGRGGADSPSTPARRGGAESPAGPVVRRKSGTFTPAPGGADGILKEGPVISRKSVQIMEPGMSPRAKSGPRTTSPSTPPAPSPRTTSPSTPPAPSPRATSARTPPAPSPRATFPRASVTPRRASSPSQKAGELQTRGITDLQSNHRRGSGQYQGRGREIPSGSEQQEITEVKCVSNNQVEWAKNVAHLSEKDGEEAVPEYIDDLARCGLETRRLMTAIRQTSGSKERGSLASARERQSRSPVCEHASVLTVSDMGRSASQVFRQSSIPDWMSKMDPVKLNTRRLVSAYARTRDSLSASRKRSSSRMKHSVETAMENVSDTLTSDGLPKSSSSLLGESGASQSGASQKGSSQRMRSADSAFDSLSGVLEGYGTPGHQRLLSNTTAGSTPLMSGAGSASTSAGTPPNPGLMSSASTLPDPGPPVEVAIICANSRNSRPDSQRSDWSDRLDTHRSDRLDTHRSDWSLASTALEPDEDARRLARALQPDEDARRLFKDPDEDLSNQRVS